MIQTFILNAARLTRGSLFSVGIPLLLTLFALLVSLLDRLEAGAPLIRASGTGVVALSALYLVLIGRQILVSAVWAQLWAGVVHLLAAIPLGAIVYLELPEDLRARILAWQMPLGVALLASVLGAAAVIYWRVSVGLTSQRRPPKHDRFGRLREGIWDLGALFYLELSPPAESQQQRLTQAFALGAILLVLAVPVRYASAVLGLPLNLLYLAFTWWTLFLGAGQQLGFAFGVLLAERMSGEAVRLDYVARG